ncbi:MAG: response regulator [Tateyamaria sp.]|uniref:hybrid sensor histidine kinase/response regulator n=1 Tax=Tateyamaria sp. TaxID=1929288 RepID=UPI00326DA9EB
MKTGLNRYRLAIFGGVLVLIVLLAAMAANLPSQLRELSRAAEDNLQWSITQIDTEFANLDAVISRQIATQSLPEETIRLRVDIALSRLAIINSGRSAEIFGDSEEARLLIEPINDFADAAIALSDAPGPLAGDALSEMQQLVSDVRPLVRDIALLGVRLGAEQAELRRTQFANQLTRTGGIAMALLVLMAILMIVLDRLLRRADHRDAELSASTKQLASTVTASLDAVVTANKSGEIIDFNTSAERIFGWKRDEIVGQTMEDTFIPHRMRDAHHNGMKRYLETGTPRVVDAGRVELAALRKGGEEFPVELNITTTQNGTDTIFIAYIRDISERKINEQKLIDARDRAERTDKAKSQFLTVMSHEMRTPLNGILGVLDLLKTTPLSEEQGRYAQIATSSSEVLLEHVNEALDITRIENGKLQLSFQDFDLGDLMRGLMDVFEPLAQEKNLTCTLEIDAAMRQRFHGDAGRIRQILTNLIGNAIKFTDEGGVHLQVSGIHGPKSSSLRFEVRDTGIGIPKGKQHQVFDDFEILASSSGRQDRGDGLGLAISRRIARAMDGDVTLTQSEETGSTFTLTFSTLSAAREEDTHVEPSVEELLPLQTRNVLIVEDNAINQSVLSGMLTAMGHSVIEAVNGLECIQKADETVFDVIFMDIGMPVMDGIEATQRLRADQGPNAQTQIIGLTAHGREEFREQAVAAGMNRFHTKPIRLDALRSIFIELASGKPSKLDVAKFPEALTEMIDMLGHARVRTVADTFFAELNALIADLRVNAVHSDKAALAEAVHKVKGAASLLGQTELQGKLSELEHEARSDTLGDLAAWANTLDSSAQKAEDSIAAAVPPESGTP